MKNINRVLVVFIMSVVSLCTLACKDLTELNINPNGIAEEQANVNLILTNVLSNTGVTYNKLNFEDLGGVVQHTQLAGWYDTHNNYAWANSSIRNWDGYYAILRDNELLRAKAIEQGLDFHHGVSLVIRAFIFGFITDLYGDAPYSDALKAELGDKKYKFPKFDSQEEIYKGIIEELKQANDLLSQPDNSYIAVSDPADIFLNGKASAWRRFANSLALRYYMRVSEKLPAFAKSGIEEITSQSDKYPIIKTSAQDVSMSFVGNNNNDSWPANTTYDANGRTFRNIKMCATLVNRLQELKDPRLSVWAKKIETPLRVDPSAPAGTDQIINGVRIVSSDKVQGIPIDQDTEYVGVPPGILEPSAYNLNPIGSTQEGMNIHVSHLNDIYKAAKGDLLKARMMSATEVYFILAEAAFKGWNVGSTAKQNYELAIENSLTTWGKTADYSTYIQGEGVKYTGELSQIIEQKWIGSWTTAGQAWFDYRRTGFPVLVSGPAAIRTQIPLRIPYPESELSVNQENASQAVDKLTVTMHTQADGKNSAWSKSWLQQGMNKPW